MTATRSVANRHCSPGCRSPYQPQSETDRFAHHPAPIHSSPHAILPRSRLQIGQVSVLAEPPLFHQSMVENQRAEAWETLIAGFQGLPSDRGQSPEFHRCPPPPITTCTAPFCRCLSYQHKVHGWSDLWCHRAGTPMLPRHSDPGLFPDRMPLISRKPVPCRQSPARTIWLTGMILPKENWQISGKAAYSPP